MTTTTREPLICECGHKGFLRLRENDQPFSGLWEDYSLEGFSGDSLTITTSADMPKDLLGYRKPTCPQCQKTGKVRYA